MKLLCSPRIRQSYHCCLRFDCDFSNVLFQVYAAPATGTSWNVNVDSNRLHVAPLIAVLPSVLPNQDSIVITVASDSSSANTAIYSVQRFTEYLSTLSDAAPPTVLPLAGTSQLSAPASVSTATLSTGLRSLILTSYDCFTYFEICISVNQRLFL